MEPGDALISLLLFGASLSALLQAPAAPLSAAGTALQAGRQRSLDSPPNEKPYDVRLHFLQSNERRHDLFFAAVRDRGGAYLGVGADQNYTLAAVAGAEQVWLVDIDGRVTEWHKIYAALVPAAPTAPELIALLDGRHGAAVREALRVRWGEQEAPPLLRAFQRDRAPLFSYLKRQRAITQGGAPVTWLGDPLLYGRVRALMQARRVVPRVGDLHGERTLVGIGAAARAAGLKVRTVYLSNAEQWFRYTPQFRRNLAALPGDEGSIVLRTLARRELPAAVGDRWHFSVQTLSDFLRRMNAETDSLLLVQGLIPDMVRAAREQGTRGLSFLGGAGPLAYGR